MPGPWTDAHCHLADPRLAAHLGTLVDRSRAAGVVSWLQGGVSPEDWARQAVVKQQVGAGVHLAFGLHPWWVSEASEQDIDDALQELEAELPRASAMGELGLDLYPRRIESAGAEERQHRAFHAQLALVARIPRPLVLHVVRAHHLVLRELERRAPFPRGGLVHAFAGTAAEAHRYVDLGFHVSVGGGVIDRPKRLRALAEIPPEAVVVETDAPDQSPRSWRLDHNEPAKLPRIAGELAPLWGLSGTELLDQAHAAMETLLSP